MAQFIAICRRAYGRFAESDFTPKLLDAEAEQARVLYGQGVFRATWGHQSPAGAVERDRRGGDQVVAAQMDLLDEVLGLDPGAERSGAAVERMRLAAPVDQR